MGNSVASKTINRIIFGIASVIALFIFTFMFNKIESQSKDIAISTTEIARTQEQYAFIKEQQIEILSQLKEISRKIDRHTEAQRNR